MGLVCSEENTYFVRAFDALGVAEETAARPACRTPRERSAR
jgi:hypothetical protein